MFSELKEISSVSFKNLDKDNIDSYAFVEGLSLSNYEFNNHKSKAKKGKNLTINIINIFLIDDHLPSFEPPSGIYK